MITYWDVVLNSDKWEGRNINDRRGEGWGKINGGEV